MNDPQNKSRTDRMISALLSVGFAVVLGILLYPSFMDEVNAINATKIISDYERTKGSLSEKEESAEKEAASNYNRKIAAEQAKQSFSYRGEYATDPEYESVLSGSDGESGGTMCFLEIPNIDIYLPVAHGTRSDILKNEAGHMYGTSVPIGGKSTNAVLAGHTGLMTADLFTDLNKMTEGDVFYIHVLGETHSYTVYETDIVLPDDEDPYLQVKDGKDIVTLYTCTPYGINDHRLLVKGERTYPDLTESQAGSISAEGRNRTAEAKAACIAAIPVSILAGGLFLSLKKTKEAGL